MTRFTHKHGGATPRPRFIADERGVVAVIFGIMLVPTLALAGFAVDYGNAVSARSKLQMATDAAAMAAVSAVGLTDSEREALAVTTFEVNKHGIAAVAVPVVSGSTVTVTATGSVPMSFAKIVGVDTMDISAASAAETASGSHLELSMMIDLTGSMGETRSGTSKIAGLRLAGKDLVDILFPNNASTSDSVRIAVAPFADYVNAGPYAAAATGQDENGAASASGPATKLYSKSGNLKKTMQGGWYGSYTGITSNSAGSQFGVQSAAVGTSTYSSGHCTGSSGLTDVAYLKHGSTGKNYGYPISVSGSPPDNKLPNGVKKATSTAKFYKTNAYDNDGSHREWEWYGSTVPSDSNISSAGSVQEVSSSYYVPLPDNASVTAMEWEKDSSGNFLGVRVGIYNVGGAAPVAQLQKASSTNKFRPVTGWSYNSSTQTGSYTYGSESSSGYFLPIPKLNQTGNASCTTAMDQPNGKLITCVTERADTTSRYTDAAPGNGTYVGKYANGSSGVSMYSEDGKCYVAGRELPSIIPLTNDRSVLDDFFNGPSNNGPQIGGATPGHIGTAWAWYMLSPNWASVWPSGSVPSSYGTEGVKKVAILMTDGEYNIHYQSPTARDQALALCENMRNAGIKIYTVGFGFSATSTRTQNTAEGKAKDLLMQCAGEQEGAYFFPYDGAALRQAFQAIGASLMGGMTFSKARLVN